MSLGFNTVAQKTTFSSSFDVLVDLGNNVKKSQKTMILEAMATAYNRSDRAAAMFDNWIAKNPTKTISILKLKNKFEVPIGSLNKGILAIDIDYIKNAKYIDANGTAVKDILVSALVHEFGHALTGRDDDVTRTDYKGANVDYVNDIYKDLNIPQQISYIAYHSEGTAYALNYNYTNGTAISAAASIGTSRITRKADWDSLELGSSKDLLIGDNRSNKLESGDGNDFLFGGLGNDTLDGGEGSGDTGVYYGLRKNYFITQADNGDWIVQGITGLGKTAGIDTLKNIEFLQFDDPDPDRPGKKKAWTLDSTFIKDVKREKSIAFVFDTTRNLVLPSLPDFLTNPFPTIVSSLDNSKILAASILDVVFADPDNDAEIGIVGFNDTTIGNSSQIALSFTEQDDFIDRKAAALEAIDSLTASDGGDIAETPFDGLLLALNQLQWRDGGTHQIFLFTDAPAKDYALADQVTALARNIGSTIASTATTALAGGALNTFNLVSSSLDETTDLYTTQVQIFTIFTGAADADTIALAAISNNNDGALLTGSTNDRLLQQILATFNPPPVDESFNRSPTNDFNGDGNSDILWRNTNGNIAIWSLDGTIATSQSLGSLTADWTIAGTGDFNGDLTEDILWRNDDGTVVAWQLNDSAFTTSTVLGRVGTDWKIAGTGDFNGDSESDILWRNNDGTVALWQLNDLAYTAGVSLGRVSADWKIAGAADFNGDGESDILWRNDNGQVAIWQINGLAYTTGAAIDRVSSDWKIAGTGDFNGDGNADILWRNDNGAVALWQMDGSTITNGAVVATVGNEWKIAGTGDFNDDGKSDILWRNDLGGVVTWQMNGSSVVAASFTSIPSVELAWKIAAPIV